MKTLNNVEFKILPKSGLDVNINTLVTNAIASAGEIHYTTDAKNLYFNNGTSNVQLATVSLMVSLMIYSFIHYNGDLVSYGGNLIHY